MLANSKLAVAHHEAGHALIAYIIGYSVTSIELFMIEGEFGGKTTYQVLDSTDFTPKNQLRRLYAALGGPAGEALFFKSNVLNLSGQDQQVVETLTTGLTVEEKNSYLTDNSREVLGLLSLVGTAAARLEIAERLQRNLSLSKKEFENIVEFYKVVKFPASFWENAETGLVKRPRLLERLELKIRHLFNRLF